MVYEFIVFTLINLGDVRDLYGQPLDKNKIQKEFINMYPNFNSKKDLFNKVEDSGIMDGRFDYFYQSSSLENNYKSRYKSQLILQENNSILGFVIFGFILGVIISFLRFYYSNYKKIINE